MASSLSPGYINSQSIVYLSILILFGCVYANLCGVCVFADVMRVRDVRCVQGLACHEETLCDLLHTGRLPHLECHDLLLRGQGATGKGKITLLCIKIICFITQTL